MTRHSLWHRPTAFALHPLRPSPSRERRRCRHCGVGVTIKEIEGRHSREAIVLAVYFSRGGWEKYNTSTVACLLKHQLCQVSSFFCYHRHGMEMGARRARYIGSCCVWRPAMIITLVGCGVALPHSANDPSPLCVALFCGISLTWYSSLFSWCWVIILGEQSFCGTGG